MKPVLWLAALALGVVLLLPARAQAQGLTAYYCFLHDAATDTLYVSPVAPVGPVPERAAYGERFRARLVASGRISADRPPAFCVMRAAQQELDQSRALIARNCSGCGPATRRVDIGDERIAATRPEPVRRVAPQVVVPTPHVKVLPNLVAPTMPVATPVDSGNSSQFAEGHVCLPDPRLPPGTIVEINNHCAAVPVTPKRAARKTAQPAGQGSGGGGSGSGSGDDGGDSGDGGGTTRPDKSGDAPVVWKEGVAVCSAIQRVCKGPMYNAYYTPATLTGALEGARCTAGRDLGQQGEWRIYGCGYGINPVIVEKSRAESWHWDWIAHLGLVEPAGRWRFRCKASQFEYCKIRA
jgi:uncharacterized membrane protein YgcG